MKRTQVDENYFKNVCDSSANMAEACRTLKLHPSTFRRIAKRLGCYDPRPFNIVHKYRKTQSKQDVIDKYLSNKVCIPPSALRQKLILHGLKEAKCEICGLDTWMGKPIPLELHHKDSNRYNNSIDNLMVLCPTCHAQSTDGTNVYKNQVMVIEPVGYVYKEPVVKVEKAEGHDVVCRVCGKHFRVRPCAPRSVKYCSYECSRMASRKFTITADHLLTMFRDTPNYTQVAKALGVTDNAVKKRCKKLGIYNEVNDMIQKEKVARGVRMRARQLSESTE